MKRKDQKKYEKAIQDKYGFTVVKWEQTKGNHIKAYINNGVDVKFVLMASTASDHRAFKNSVAMAARVFN